MDTPSIQTFRSLEDTLTNDHEKTVEKSDAAVKTCEVASLHLPSCVPNTPSNQVFMAYDASCLFPIDFEDAPLFLEFDAPPYRALENALPNQVFTSYDAQPSRSPIDFEDTPPYHSVDRYTATQPLRIHVEENVSTTSNPPRSPRHLIDSNSPRYNNMRASLLDYWIDNKGYNPDYHDAHDPLPFVNGLPADFDAGDRDFQLFLDELMASGSYSPDPGLRAELEAKGYTFSA